MFMLTYNTPFAISKLFERPDTHVEMILQGKGANVSLKAAAQDWKSQSITYHVIATPPLVGVRVCRICAWTGVSNTDDH